MISIQSKQKWVSKQLKLIYVNKKREAELAMTYSPKGLPPKYHRR